MKLEITNLNIEGLTAEENQSVAERLEQILMSWEGTRYLPGSQVKQCGVDCVRFVSGVLDELYGEQTPLPRLPQDASFHAKDTCYSALKDFLSRYSCSPVEDGKLQPGDVLIAGPNGGGPGHALIVGKDCIWHCDSRSVVKTGLGFNLGGAYFLKRIYRGCDRERWA